MGLSDVDYLLVSAWLDVACFRLDSARCSGLLGERLVLVLSLVMVAQVGRTPGLGRVPPPLNVSAGGMMMEVVQSPTWRCGCLTGRRVTALRLRRLM